MAETKTLEEKSLTEQHLIILEEELRHQREIIHINYDVTNRGFEQVDKRFEEMLQYTNKRFDQVDKRFEDLIHYMDKRFEQVDKRFEEMLQYMDKRFDQVDKRFEDMLHYMDKRFDQVEKRFNSMQWMIGIGFSAIAVLMTILKIFAK